MKTVAMLLACAVASAQQAPVFRSAAKVVLVDAVVTGKKGEYIRDLSAKDFRVWEDGKEQTIRSFTLAADSSAAEPSDTPRRLVLLFDNIGMSAGDQASARQVAASFVDARVPALIGPFASNYSKTPASAVAVVMAINWFDIL